MFFLLTFKISPLTDNEINSRKASAYFNKQIMSLH